MKYLLVFAVVMIAVYFWRKGRREELRARSPTPTPKAKAPPAVGAPQDMVRCAHCGMHLPATEAIAGPGDSYCSVAHRKADGG